jgi:hypothetical protein
MKRKSQNVQQPRNALWVEIPASTVAPSFALL